ncbi:hypothetical protein DFJ58DRAFT_762017, partial [Suillus subalutaceus]|uniref:uncharacterized protein n=1 Tax=Suillus subalutaceus TaxID=48586 RepID=UPI001B86C3E9
MSCPSHSQQRVGVSIVRPFTQLVKQVLTIKNKNAQPVAFKVKTTAPKLYCVRPNSGRIEPGESVDVSVSLITPEKETRDLQEFVNEWKVYQQKLRVVYLLLKDKLLKRRMRGHVEPPMPSRPIAEHLVEPSPRLTPPMPEFSYDDAVQAAQLKREVNSSQEAGSYREEFDFQRSTSGGVGVVNRLRLPSINKELEAKYIAAQDEIQRLRDLLAAVPDPSSLAPESIAPTSIAPSDFRRRHTSALSDDGETYAGSDVGTMVEHDSVIHQEGVPLQVVVIIALGVFYHNVSIFL